MNYSLDRKAINEASCLGFCPPTSVIVPRVMDFALQTPGLPYDVARAKQLLKEAGYPNGLDAGEFVPIPPFFATAEAAVNYLNAAGIRVRIRTLERASFYAAWREKKLRGSSWSRPAAPETRPAGWRSSSTPRGLRLRRLPDIDDLVVQQARERDPRKREAISPHQADHDRPGDVRAHHGLPHAAWRRPRVAEHMLDTSTWCRPGWEDMRMKPQ